MPLPGNKAFWFPSHWLELGDLAFAPSLVDHDGHGFSQDFIARQEDRDRYLEDYLNTLVDVDTGGLQGDYIDLHNASVAVASGSLTTVDMGSLTIAESLGTSITVDTGAAPKPLRLSAAGYYHVEATINFPTGGTPTVFYVEIGDQSSFDWFIGDSKAPAPYSGSTRFTLASMYHFPDGGFGAGKADFLRLKLYQDSGGSLNVNVTFKVVRLA